MVNDDGTGKYHPVGVCAKYGEVGERCRKVNYIPKGREVAATVVHDALRFPVHAQ